MYVYKRYKGRSLVKHKYIFVFPTLAMWLKAACWLVGLVWKWVGDKYHICNSFSSANTALIQCRAPGTLSSIVGIVGCLVANLNTCILSCCVWVVTILISVVSFMTRLSWGWNCMILITSRNICSIIFFKKMLTSRFPTVISQNCSATSYYYFQPIIYPLQARRVFVILKTKGIGWKVSIVVNMWVGQLCAVNRGTLQTKTTLLLCCIAIFYIIFDKCVFL